MPSQKKRPVALTDAERRESVAITTIGRVLRKRDFVLI